MTLVTCMHDLHDEADKAIEVYMDSISKMVAERPLAVDVSPTKIERDMKAIVYEAMEKVNAYWVEMCEAHRPYCKPEGNKMLTRMMGKKNRI